MRATDFVNQVSEQALPKDLEKVRGFVVTALSEILTQGARVRPLLMGEEEFLVRGLRVSERVWLHRHFKKIIPHLKQVVKLATNIPDSVVSSLSLVEMKRLNFIIQDMTARDDSLMDWVRPFVYTVESGILYHAGTKPVEVLDIPNWECQTKGVCELYRHWCYYCKRREERINETQQLYASSMLVRVFSKEAGQNLVKSLSQDLKDLQYGSTVPWMDAGLVFDDVDLDDGWGHTIQDCSRSGILRELHGMLNHDKHEQVMAAIAQQKLDEESKEQARLQSLRSEIDSKLVVKEYIAGTPSVVKGKRIWKT